MREIGEPYKRRISEQKTRERENRYYWPIQNSPLLPPPSKVEEDKSFQRSFLPILPEQQNLKGYIEEKLNKKYGKVLAIEL